MHRSRSAFAAALLSLLLAGCAPDAGPPPAATTPLVAAQRTALSSGQAPFLQEIGNAYVEQRSRVQVQGWGTVVKLLRDDNRGSRHQRFLLHLDNDLTVLVAHNIDVAPPIDKLAIGDRVDFHGEYTWNDKGGVIHWTHHDPRGRHTNGWLEHRSRRYQ